MLTIILLLALIHSEMGSDAALVNASRICHEAQHGMTVEMEKTNCAVMDNQIIDRASKPGASDIIKNRINELQKNK